MVHSVEGLQMYVKNLTLVHFRNYKKACIEPQKEMNVILGPNAQGKSNLLEALFLFTTGKSFRANREAELIKWGEKFSRLTLEVLCRNQEKIKLEISIQKTKNKKSVSKVIKVNNHIARSASDLVGTLRAVLFSPDDIEIIKGPPGARRRFIDLQSSQISPLYCSNLRSYYKVLEQRNSLLRNSDSKENLKMLDIWDEQLAGYGSILITQRLENLEKLDRLAGPIVKDITEGKEKLELTYFSTVNIGGKKIKSIFPGMEKKEFEKILEENIIKQLKIIREQDFKKGLTSIGPHRDDLHILINEKPLKNFGSQGQKRTVALCLKLAEMNLIYDITGEHPLLLLDDITSELDKERCSRLLNYIKGKGQIFFTINQKTEFLNPLCKNASFLHIYGGTVKLGILN